MSALRPIADVDLRAIAHQELVTPRATQVFDGVDSFLDLPFASPAGYRPLRLDLHVPRSPANSPLPTVIYAHGGGFLGGTRAMGPWRFLLEAGYAVASIDYRLSAEAQFPDPVEDFAAAVRYVRANAAPYGLDGDRLIGFGSSAGAYLAAAAALHCHTGATPIGPHQAGDERLIAVIDHYGPTDFRTLDEDAHPETVEYARTPGSSADRFLGYLPSNFPDRAAAADLPRRVTTSAPPFFIAHGDDDRRVGIGQSRRLVDALRSHGVPVTFVAVPGADHAGPQFDQPAMHDAILTFLRTVP